jgi:hypothetical protein
VQCKLSLQVMWKWEQKLNNFSSCNANCKLVLHDHLLLKTSKQLSVCIFYQNIHEALSSCNWGSWLRGGAVVVTSGSANIEPLEQGRRMGARRSPEGLCCLEEGNSLDLQGCRGMEPRRPSALPRRDGEALAAAVSARLCARGRRGREMSLVLHLGGGWSELRTAAIPIRGALRLPAAAKTCRPSSTVGGELKRYNPNHLKKKKF